MSKCVVSAVWFLSLSLAVCSAEEAGLMGVSPIICTDVYSLFFDGLKWDLCLLSCYPRPYSLSFCFFSFFMLPKSCRFSVSRCQAFHNCQYLFLCDITFYGVCRSQKGWASLKSFHLRLVDSSACKVKICRSRTVTFALGQRCIIYKGSDFFARKLESS